jgi:hypothetical protein
MNYDMQCNYFNLFCGYYITVYIIVACEQLRPSMEERWNVDSEGWWRSGVWKKSSSACVRITFNFACAVILRGFYPFVLLFCLTFISTIVSARIPKLYERVLYIWCEVSTTATMKNAVFWDVPPGGSRKNRYFEESFAYIIRVQRISELGTT